MKKRNILLGVLALSSLALFSCAKSETTDNTPNTPIVEPSKETPKEEMSSSKETKVPPVIEDNVIYEMNESKTGYIVTGIDDKTVSEIEIKSTINSLPVVEIRNNALNGTSNLETLKAPIVSVKDEYGDLLQPFASIFGYESFEKASKVSQDINGYHFYSIIPNNLKNIYVTKGTSIPSGYFSNLITIENIYLPEGLTEIGEYAFQGCGFRDIDIPSTVKKIDESAFLGCYKLKNISLNNGLEAIESNAFGHCLSLTHVTIPSTVNSIGNNVFDVCDNLVEVYNLSNATVKAQNVAVIHTSLDEKSILTTDSNGFEFAYYMGQAALIGYTGDDNKIVLPDKFIYEGNEIKSYGIMNPFINDNIVSITIPASVTNIINNAFINQSKIVEVYNLSTVDISTYITPLVIHTSLDEESIVFDDGDYTFANYEDKCYLLSYNGIDSDLDLPETVKKGDDTIDSYEVYNYAFAGYKNNFLKQFSSYSYVYQPYHKVNIPASVTKLGSYAFFSCGYIDELLINNEKIKIEDYCFWECDLSYNYSDSVGYIGSKENPYMILFHVSLINSVIIHKDCKQIYYDHFMREIYEIYNLSDLNIEIGSDDYTGIAKHAFVIHKSLDEKSVLIKDENGFVFAYFNNKGYLIGKKYSSDDELILPESFKYGDEIINSYEVKNLSITSGYRSITIPSSVTKIEDNVFFLSYGNIEKVNIPAHLFNMFIQSNSVKEIVINSGETLEISANYYNSNASLLKLTLPSTLTSITGSNVLYTNLYEIYNLSNIELLTNNNCNIAKYTKVIHTSLDEKSIYVDEGDFTFTYLNNQGYLMRYNGNNNKVILPDSFTYDGKVINSYIVKSHAIYNGYNRHELVCSNSVTKIEEYALYAFSKITLNDNIKSLGKIDIYDGEYNEYEGCYYLGSSTNPYLCLVKSNYQITEVKVHADCKLIAESAFKNNTTLTSITLPNGLKYINYDAFNGCSGLTSITLPESLLEIDGYAFQGTHITNIVLPNNVTYLGGAAFMNSNLTSITISNSLTYIGIRAFDNTKISDITLPKTITHIGQRAFNTQGGVVITYNGTKAEWAVIEKQANWNYQNSVHKVTCTDGDAEI